MARRAFGPWQPDTYGLNTELTGDASGVLPTANGYGPWPDLSAVSAALAATCFGATTIRKTDGTLVVYAGTATKLYRYASLTSWTDVTRAAGGDYSLPSGEYWSFAQFGANLIAVQGGDVPQTIDVDSGTNFAALGGSPPTASFVKTMGDQLFLYGLTSNRNRLQWSGRNNSAYWTAGQRDSDFQDFPDGGWVNGLTSLEAGLVFQEGAIRAMRPSNDRTIYNFRRLEETRGLLAENSLVTYGPIAYFLSEDGFYAQSGVGGSKAIGLEKVNDWFQSDANTDRLFSVIGAPDPIRPRVFWLYPSTGSTSNVLDKCLCYDIGLDRWSHADVSASIIFPASTPITTLEDLDTISASLDALGFSLDSRWLRGGAPYLGAFDSDDKLAFVSGSAKAALLETSDFQEIPGRRAYVHGIEPFTNADTVTVTVGSKERAGDDISWDSGQTVQTTGEAPARSEARYHRVRVEMAAGEDWEHINGLDVKAVDAGEH